MRTIEIRGNGTQKLLVTDEDMAFLYDCGISICPGCGRSLVAGEMFCAPCHDKVMEMEEIIRPRFSWKHPNVIMAGLAAFWAIAILAWWLA